MNTDDILLLKTYDKRISIFYRIKEELRRSWSVLINRQQIGIDICNNNYTNKNTTTIKNELSLLKSSITIKPHYYICRFTFIAYQDFMVSISNCHFGDFYCE